MGVPATCVILVSHFCPLPSFGMCTWRGGQIGRGMFYFTYLERVGFGVEDVLVRAVVVDLPDVVWGVDEVAIIGVSIVRSYGFLAGGCLFNCLPVLEDLCEPERLLKVHETATAGCVHVVD